MFASRTDTRVCAIWWRKAMLNVFEGNTFNKEAYHGYICIIKRLRKIDE